MTITVNGVSQDAPVDPTTGAFSSTFDTHDWPANPAGFTVTYRYAGDRNFNGPADGSSSLVVQPVATLVAEGTTIQATEGAAITSVAVATFTDALGDGTASRYTASIDWGDGKTSTASGFDGTIVPNGDRGFTVLGTRPADSASYVEEGKYNVNVTVADGNGASATATSTVQVADAELTATATPVTKAIEGAAFSGEVATFTDANPAAPLSDFPVGLLKAVTIDWGDGTTSDADATSITQPLGVGTAFHVFGSHTYAEEGATKKPLVVTIADIGGAVSSTTPYNPTVLDAPLTAGALTPPTATEGAAFSNVLVFHFTDADPERHGQRLHGRGHPGRRQHRHPDQHARHQRPDRGQRRRLRRAVVLHLRRGADQPDLQRAGHATTRRDEPAPAPARFSVADAALTAGTLTPPAATEGAAFSNVAVFHFTDADPAGTASDYTAMVDLGDGNTVTLTSTPSADGQIVPTRRRLRRAVVLHLRRGGQLLRRDRHR